MKQNKVYEITTKRQLNAILELNLITVIDFNAKWCKPCEKIKPEFNKLPIKYKDFVFLSINVDKSEELSKQFHIKTLPTFILMDKSGEFDRILGLNLNKLVEILNQFIGRTGRIV